MIKVLATKIFRPLLQIPNLIYSDGEMNDIPPSLDETQIKEFNANGYMVFNELFTKDEILPINKRIESLLKDKISIPKGVKFEVEPAEDNSSDASWNKIRQIWDLAPHDPVITNFVINNPKVIGILKSLLGRDISLFRTTAMLKPQYIGSEKPYHQDSAYWPITPMNLVSCWIALEDATSDNGCLKLIPGSHHNGLASWSSEGINRVMENSINNISDELTVEVKAGSCIVFHSLLAHCSGPNRSSSTRYALINSYMSSKSKYTGSGMFMNFTTVCGKRYFNHV